MQRSERYEARRLGLPTFNTGKPCINGHMTFRYSSSGACSECNKYAMKNRTIANRKGWVQIALRAFYEDCGALSSVVYGFALLRNPQIKPTSVFNRKGPSKRESGTALYHFLVHPDDADQLKTAAADMINVRCAHLKHAGWVASAISQIPAPKVLPAFKEETMYDD